MDALRIVNSVLALLGCGLWLALAVRRRLHYSYIIAPITYLLHVFLYYAARPWLWMEPLSINLWSTAVRTHSLLMISGLAFLLLLIERSEDE